MTAIITAHWPWLIFAGAYLLSAAVLFHELLNAVWLLEDEEEEDDQ